MGFVFAPIKQYKKKSLDFKNRIKAKVSVSEKLYSNRHQNRTNFIAKVTEDGEKKNFLVNQ
ncbi:hypothetical protein QR98_0075610 [Sarcoptes scabiei]|uniref:Uncharacterized protein n=1 Tax=Sarcoptes scabiei TaxID=52283 RepID=A0A132ADI1_SARSC|nr:hypothetical protein QR98_0075610 [Sarcoptes scabiei]